MTWNALPAGDAIALVPANYYAVVASLKATHSQADVTAMAAARGLTLLDYAEQGTRAGLGPDPRSPDYRYIAAMAVAQAAGTLPWSVPWPLSLVDGSQIVSAWTNPPTTIVPTEPAPPAPIAPLAPASPSLMPLATLGAAAAGLWWWGARRRRRVIE